MTDSTTPCPMCGLNLFQNDKRAETRRDSFYCGSRDCGLFLLWMAPNDIRRMDAALKAAEQRGWNRAIAAALVCQKCDECSNAPMIADAIRALPYEPETGDA